MIRTVHRARYVLAEADVVLQNGAVHVCDPGRICRIGPWHATSGSRDCEVRDWGSAVLLPGLVNCHTHLEFTRARGCIPPPESFTQWISDVIRTRQDWSQEDWLESIRLGAALSIAAGTTLVGDISATGLSARALACTKLRRVIFEETLSLDPDAACQSVAAIEARIAKSEKDPLLTSGISPHAPYTVSRELFLAATKLAGEKDLPLAVHLAETQGETDFLLEGRGEFRDFLSGLGVLPSGWFPPRLPPVAYLDRLGVLDRSPLLIHCNYLDSDAIARILARRCSVAYCPRSHAYFGHSDHPVRMLLDAGVNVAIGTDSLASNDTLSMLDEMRFLFRQRKDLKCAEILRMATLNGAAALGFGGVLGRLRRGSWADITVLRIPEDLATRNLVAQILEGAGDCIATIVRGEIAWQK